MLVRRIARPLLASGFVADGVDVLRNPEPHVDRTTATYDRLAPPLGLPRLDRSQVRTLVRAQGAAATVAGVALALGKAPRAAALLLAVLTVPAAVVNEPFGARGETADATRERFLRNVTMVGAALLAAVDRQGRPSLGWRLEHAKVERAAAKEAREAVTEARAAVTEARRQAKAAARASRQAPAAA